jgi:RNA polymerase sigma-70 factor, ECF subfamily
MTDLNQFEAFMRSYQDMVYSTAVRLLANPADAEDIAQTVFLKAYEHFETLATSPTAGGWLKTVTTNLCLNHLSRYRSRWRLFSDLRAETEDEPAFVESVAAPETFEQDLAEADYRRLLEQAIQKLPHAQRVPLVLFHFEDRPYEEIARRLAVSLSKVKTDIHRGRLALKRFLKSGLSGEERWQAPPEAPAAPDARRNSSSALPPRDHCRGQLPGTAPLTNPPFAYAH